MRHVCLLPGLLALLLLACGEGDENECEGREGFLGQCPFFAQDGSVTPEQLKRIQRQAVPVRENEGFVQGQLVPPQEPGNITAAFFSFPAQARHRYLLGCQGVTVEACSVVILDGSGRRAGGDDLPAPGRENRAFFRATRSETHFAVVLPFAASSPATGTFLFRLRNYGQDAHGDNASEASLRTPSSEPIAGVLQGSGDRDVFSLDASAGQLYRFTCEGPQRDVPWKLRLEGVNVEGVTVLGGSGPASLWFKLNAAGRVHVTIEYSVLEEDLRIPREFSAPDYTCRLEAPDSDDHGDTAERATALSVPAADVTGAMEWRGDVDVFSLPFEAGHYYVVRCITASPGWCTPTLEGLTAFPVPGGGVWKANGTRPHFLWISAGGAYSLFVEDLGQDAHGNTPQEATPITASDEPFTGRLEASADGDYFAFDAQAGFIYRADCEWPETAPQDGTARMTMLSSDNVPFTEGTSQGPQRAFIAFEARSTGRHLLRMTALSLSAPLTYRCTLRMQQDDHGDTRAEATELSFPASLTVTAETQQDHDVLRFSLEADHAYRFTCAHPDSACTLTLRDASGGILASRFATLNATLDHAPQREEVVYLEVVGSFVTFTLTATDLGPDDHGDTSGTATPITLGTPVHVHAPRADSDYLRFDGDPRRHYRVRCEQGGTPSAPTHCGLGTLTFDPRITFAFTSEGHLVNVMEALPVFIVLSGDGYGAGETTVTVEDMGPDDHGDLDTDATALPLGAPMSGSLEIPSDLDVFTATLTVGEARQVLRATGVSVTVKGPNGLSLRTDAEGRFTPTVSGAYTFTVQSSSSEAVPSYTLELR